MIYLKGELIMNVKKIMSFSEEEIETLKAAGKLLGAIRSALNACEIDSLDDQAKNLLKALDVVLTEVKDR